MVHANGPVINVLEDRACHILELIGNTPLLRLNHVGREFPHVEFYAKAEWFNPGGSVNITGTVPRCLVVAGLDNDRISIGHFRTPQ